MVIKNIQYFSDIDEMRRSGDFNSHDSEWISNESLGDDKINVSAPLFRLRNTDLMIAEGTYYSFDEDTGGHNPDFCVALLYDSSKGLDISKPVYWEQGTPASMFHSYVLKQINKGGEKPSLILEAACVA